MAKTFCEQLDSVQAAIATIEASPNAQVTVLGRTFTKQNLQVLYDREEYLRPRAMREAAGGGVITKQVVPL